MHFDPMVLLADLEKRLSLTVEYCNNFYRVISNTQTVIEKIRSLEPFISGCDSQTQTPIVSLYSISKPIPEKLILDIQTKGTRISIDQSLYEATASEGFRYELEEGKYFIFILKTKTLLYFLQNESLIFLINPDETNLSVETNRLLKGLISIREECKGQLMLHASGIVHPEGCTLFLADSRNGKTTVLLDALTHFAVDMLSCDTSFLQIKDQEMKATGWPSNFSVSVGTMYDYKCLHSLIPEFSQNLSYNEAWKIYDKYVVDTKEVLKNIGKKIITESKVKAMIALNFSPEDKTGLFHLTEYQDIRSWVEKTYLGSRDILYPNWHEYWSLTNEEIEANIDRFVRMICEKGISFYQMNWAPSATTLLRRIPEIASLHALHSSTIGFSSKKNICAGGIIRNPLLKEQVVIVNQQGCSWSLPKGHVEQGEDCLQAAKREIYEETGIKDLILEKELGSYERTALSNNGSEISSERKTIHMFLFRTNTKKLCPLDPENPAAKWVNQEECLKLLTHPKDKEFFIKTTDALEPIDVLDAYTLEKTGRVLPRSEIYRLGEWHAVFHLWIVNGNKRSLYVQKRSQNKLFSKGLLDATVGGTLRSGEEIKDAAREVEEELQLHINFNELRFVENKYHMVREEKLVNHQICHTFLYDTDLPLDNIRFNTHEISGMFEIPFDELYQIFDNPGYEYSAEGIGFKNDLYVTEKLTVRKDLFVPTIDRYPCKITKFLEALNEAKNPAL